MTGGWLQGFGDDTSAWQRTAAAFTAAVESGRLDLPLPGAGATWERWAVFADLAEEDLSLARLGEGHADAAAILAELGGPPPRAASRKRAAISCFASQTTDRGHGLGPVLPPGMIAHFTRAMEVLFRDA